MSTSLSEWLSWEVVKGSRALPSMAVQTDHPVGLGAPLIALDRLKGKKERGEAGRLIGVSREGGGQPRRKEEEEGGHVGLIPGEKAKGKNLSEAASLAGGRTKVEFRRARFWLQIPRDKKRDEGRERSGDWRRGSFDLERPTKLYRGS